MSFLLLPPMFFIRLAAESHRRHVAFERDRVAWCKSRKAFSKGVLKPVEQLQLREEQRVRLIIEPVDAGRESDRTAALNRLRAGIASMAFFSPGRLPARDDLPDRS